MSSANPPPYDTILKLCAQAGAEPWYPAEFAASMGIDKRKLEGPLDDLRLAGLIEKTDWQPGKEQGYRLTRDGQAVVNSPPALARVREGQLPRVAHEASEPREEPEATPQRHRNAVLAGLIGSGRPVMTYSILAVNVGLYLLQMYLALRGKQGGMQNFLMQGDADAWHQTGGLRAADLLQGEWWRLVSTIFVHASVFRLLINFSTFLSVGPQAEQIWGKWRYLAIYLLAGFGSVCVTLWYLPIDAKNPGHPIFGGAAGSMCGLMLATAAWFVLNQSHMPREVAGAGFRRVMMALIWWIVWMGLLSWLSREGYALVTYIAGAAVGLLVGILFNIQRYWHNPIRWAFLILVPIVPIVCIGLVLHSKEHDPRWRQAKVEQKEQKDADEFKTFNKRILPHLDKAEKFMQDPWDDAWNLLLIEPKDRPAERIAKTQTTLREMREQIDQTVELIDKLGPFEVAQVARAVKAGRDFIVAEKELIQSTERILAAADELTDQKKAALKAQVKDVEKAIRIYNKKFE